MIGLIPAAGTAERWGGYIKELLPINEYSKLIDHTIGVLESFGCTEYLVITNTEKIGLISSHLSKHNDLNISYIIGGNTMWESINKSLSTLLNYDSVVLMMPDTYLTSEIPPYRKQFSLGIFKTYYPDQFSIIIDNKLYTKDTKFVKYENHYKKFDAWGIVNWSYEVTELWLQNPIEKVTDKYPEFLSYNISNYDTMFQMAINEFGLSTFKIKEYYDMKNFSAYKEFLCQKK